MLILPQQVLGLVADHQVGAAGNAEFDVDDRRDGAGAVLGALVDADPAGDQPVVELFEVGHPGADLLLGPFRAVDIVKCDFQRHLQHAELHILGAFGRQLLTPGQVESLQRMATAEPSAVRPQSKGFRPWVALADIRQFFSVRVWWRSPPRPRLPPIPAFKNGLPTCGRRPRRSAFRAARSTRRRAGSNPI
jgi:hypothetical protein